MDIAAFIILSPLWLAFALYILYETSAVYEYSRFLPEFITRRKEYLRLGEPNGVSYSLYMRTEYDSFLMRMMACPNCMGAWISLLIVGIYGRWEFLPFVYLLGRLGHLWFVWAQESLKRSLRDE